MRIPFDSLTLCAAIAEAQVVVGTKLDRVLQTDGSTIVLGCYGDSGAWFLVSADPVYSRAHLIARRPEGLKPVPPFALDLRKHLAEGVVRFVRQRGLDRILEIGVDAADGSYQIVAELMGKHSNIMLVKSDRTVVAAAKWVGATKSLRPVLPGKPYAPPPFEPKPSVLTAKPGDPLNKFEGVSPFLSKLIEAGTPLETVQAAIQSRKFSPVYSEGHGAYPLSVVGLGLPEVARSSLSFALEQHYEGLIEHDRFVSAQSGLRAQLQRVLLAREVALNGIGEALEAARDARHIQTMGELILAYQGQIKPESRTLEAYDYEGKPLTIALKPDQTPVENANRYFLKAKKAKSRASEMESQLARVSTDVSDLTDALAKVETALTTRDLEEVHVLADKRRWLQRTGEAKPREERPFEGNAVRELISPGGWRVLYGDNATSNDYLTGRVARPSDLWFHVRGAPSAHVVLCTNNQPAKVQKADLEFAAKVAVSHSPSKHASYVSVDYTQKRYVRKPRGAAAGLAVYTNEKTIHVTADKP